MPSSDPARALQNRLIKDRLYAERVARLAREHRRPVLEVDGTRDITDEVDALLQIEGVPDVDLHAVRRWENEAAAANIRAWFASPEAPRTHPRFPFACECGTPGCAETVQLTLAEFEARDAVRSHL